MNYREFYLINGKNARFELTNVKQFLNDPSGLGYAKTYTTMRLGNVDVVTSEQFNLPIFQGSLMFMGLNADIYQSYQNMIAYLTEKPIKLYYLPPNETEPFFAEVNVVQIDKSEISENDGALSCPIQMKLTEFWQTSTQNEITIEPSFEAGKSYPLLRPYHYGGSSLSNISVYNDGTLEAPLVIEIIGECETPQINFYQNDIQYGAIKLNGTFDHVLINSKDDEENIELQYNGSVLANPLGYQDLSVGNPNQIYVTFVKLKQGLSKITVSFSSIFNGEVKIRWNDTYVSI